MTEKQKGVGKLEVRNTNVCLTLNYRQANYSKAEKEAMSCQMSMNTDNFWFGLLDINGTESDSVALFVLQRVKAASVNLTLPN